MTKPAHLRTIRARLIDLNRLIRNAGIKKSILYSEVNMLWRKFNGRCAFCGISLDIRANVGPNASRFTFYTPLKYGGEVKQDNIVLACSKCAERYTPRREMREEIPDLNTLGDTIEQFIRAIYEDRERANKATREKVQRIKRYINLQIEELAVNMRYKTFKDWAPDEFIMLFEGENTIPDIVEKMIDEPEEAKKEMEQSWKQIMTTKQYKILKGSSS